MSLKAVVKYNLPLQLLNQYTPCCCTWNNKQEVVQNVILTHQSSAVAQNNSAGPMGIYNDKTPGIHERLKTQHFYSLLVDLASKI